MGRIRTCLWFNGNGAAAARFYTGLIADSAIESALAPGAEPTVINFHLAGVPYMALNGGPHYAATPAASIMVMTDDQAETDRLWDALIADGGKPSRCAWCTDKYGVSWQVVPRRLPDLIGGPDQAAAGRATQAMLAMSKIDIAALEAAYAGQGG